MVAAMEAGVVDAAAGRRAEAHGRRRCCAAACAAGPANPTPAAALIVMVGNLKASSYAHWLGGGGRTAHRLRCRHSCLMAMRCEKPVPMAPHFGLHARQPLILGNSREAHDEQAAALNSFTSGCPGAHHWAAAAARLSRRRRSTCSVSCGSWKKANRFEARCMAGWRASMHGAIPHLSTAQ